LGTVSLQDDDHQYPPLWKIGTHAHQLSLGQQRYLHLEAS
jgi:hypothetical protein